MTDTTATARLDRILKADQIDRFEQALREAYRSPESMLLKELLERVDDWRNGDDCRKEVRALARRVVEAYERVGNDPRLVLAARSVIPAATTIAKLAGSRRPINPRFWRAIEWELMDIREHCMDYEPLHDWDDCWDGYCPEDDE